MPKYFNTQFGPIRYNSDGQTVDGLTWLECEETPEIVSALQRDELLKVDSSGNFIYDSNEEPDNDTGDFSPKKKANSKEKLEG